MNLYPLKFKPIYKERLWGGNKLNKLLHKNINSPITGESWEISGVDGDVSEVSNGVLKNTSLQELIDRCKDKLVGKKVYKQFKKQFPILIKFIDAQKDLSIQVHPNDTLAQERHNSFGKTEMWYIMQADANAELIIGFNKNVTQEEYLQKLQKNELKDILHTQKVTEGDTFFINTGKVHAIGGGILLAEIQQTSDVTYRIYDWNRKDKEGNARELHTHLALDAIDYQQKSDFKTQYAEEENVRNKMVNCPYFTTNYIVVTKKMEYNLKKRDSFTIYICVEGETEVKTKWGSETLKKGETLLLPAQLKRVTLVATSATLLEVYL